MWFTVLLALTGPVAVDSTSSLFVPVGKAESLRVTIAGEGDPVVLIPGLVGSAFGFRKIIPLMTRDGYRVFVIEPLGFGGSARPAKADYSLTAQADRVAAVLESLGVANAWVVAHSVGASIAFRLALRRPGLVRGILSVEGGPVEQATTRGFRRALQFVPWIRIAGGIKVIRKETRKGLIHSSGDSTWVTDEVVQGYTAGAAADLDGTLKAYLGMERARERQRLRDHLGEIAVPVLLLRGSAPHEGGVPPGDIERLRHALRAFRVDTVAGGGHHLHEERPDAVVAALRRLRAWLLAEAVALESGLTPGQ